MLCPSRWGRSSGGRGKAQLLYQTSEILTLDRKGFPGKRRRDSVPPVAIDSGAIMGTAIPVKRRLGATDLRKRACASQDTDQARRLLALAAVLDGQSRGAAARIGGMDRQTLRDWVHAYNAKGPNGLINATSPGRPPKLTKAQKEKLRPIVVAGPDLAKDGVVRWRCVDLKRVIKERFGVDLGEISVGRLLKELGFSYVSARPQHPEQSPQAIEDYKKNSQRQWRKR